jgi:hypothetical protein
VTFTKSSEATSSRKEKFSLEQGIFCLSHERSFHWIIDCRDNSAEREGNLIPQYRINFKISEGLLEIVRILQEYIVPYDQANLHVVAGAFSADRRDAERNPNLRSIQED